MLSICFVLYVLFVLLMLSVCVCDCLSSGGLRKTESVPPSLGGRLAAEVRGRAQRPHAKANTINLPTTTIKHDDANKLGAAVAANNTSATAPPQVNVSDKRSLLLYIIINFIISYTQN